MTQLDIFELDLTSTLSNVGTFSIKEEENYAIPSGTQVIINHYFKNTPIYEVINDDGVNASIQYKNIGFRNNQQKEEMTIPSKDIRYIVEGEDIIQLPKHRPNTLNIEFYRNRAANLLKEIASDRSKQLDFLTYYLLVTPSSIANSDVEFIWDYLLANEGSKVEYRIFSMSSYAQKHDFQNLLSFEMLHTGLIRIYFGIEKNKFEFHVSDIIEHFHVMLDKSKVTPAKQLSPYELMFLYRVNGYLLTYKAGTDEWFFQHPDSKKIMQITNKDDLYNTKDLIQKYENKYRKRTFISSMMVTSLDLFEDVATYEGVQNEGFTVPSGTIVKIHSSYGFTNYVVIEDNGKKVKLHEENDTDNILTVSSDLMYWFLYPHENRHVIIRLPRFNRSKSVTIEKLVERDRNYYHSLSEKEFLDAAVLRAVSTANQSIVAKIIRALSENDEDYAKELIKSTHNGIFSSNFRFNSTGNIKKLEFGLREQSRDITLNATEIVKHLNKMLSNVANYSINQLSIWELKLAYYVRGYKLTYNTVTDEFVLSKGIVSYDVKEGRKLLNDFDQAIQALENNN